jgi:gas vesicle structural protein
MSATALQRGGGGGYVQRSSSSGLYDVLDLILDKGLVIDVFLRVSLVGIELLTVDARIVIASVDTYLRFAEAVNRLDLTESGGQGLPDIMSNLTEGGAESKTRGVLEGARQKLFGGDEEEGESGGSSSESSSGSSQRARSTSRQRASTRGRS